MSIAQSILDIAIAAAEAEGAQRILQVNMVAGELRAIEPVQLTFCFGIVAQDTIASAAHLNLEIIPVKGKCRQCEETFPVKDYDYTCPKCNSQEIQIVGGRELRLVDIEVE